MIQEALKHLKSVDPVLESLMDRIGPVTIRARRLPVFQSLVEAIICQQLNSRAAGTILSRLKALGHSGPTGME